ncbi:unnamed protein product, partial [Polarella glacialis]
QRNGEDSPADGQNEVTEVKPDLEEEQESSQPQVQWKKVSEKQAEPSPRLPEPTVPVAGLRDLAFPALTPTSDAGSASRNRSRPRSVGPLGRSSDDRLLPKEDAENDILARKVQLAENRLVQRRATAEKYRQDVQRLQLESASFLKEEARFLEEATAARLQGGGHEEALRSQHAEIQRKLAEYPRRAVEHKAREREWREELESMYRQQETAAEFVDGLRATHSRSQKAAAEQVQRVAKAEAKLKRLEARRADLRAE